MKRVILFVLFVSFLAGCGSVGYTYRAKSGKAFLTVDNPKLYMFNADSTIGDYANINLPMKRKDSVSYHGYEYGYGVKRFVITYKDNSYYLEDAIDGIDYRIINQFPTFKVPKEKDQEAWSRAMRFINKHSSMKVQTQGDLLIETYNPIKPGQRGFSVNKYLEGDEYVYEVECSTKQDYSNTSYVYKQMFAYYILTGRETSTTPLNLAGYKIMMK